MSELLTKDALYNQLSDVYHTKGYDVLLDKCWKLMSLAENKAFEQKYRSIKGELAEIVLEFGLWEIQKAIDYPTVTLKGLCIPFRTGNNATTEMDIVFITPYKIYMFECKSYKNCPKVTDKCLLGDSTDVYNQQRLHTIALNQYISKAIKKCEVKPYRCILFEMSYEGLNDVREDVYKASMPIFSAKDWINSMVDELTSNRNNPAFIDVKQCVKILSNLDNNSKEMFKKHLQRLGG